MNKQKLLEFITNKFDVIGTIDLLTSEKNKSLVKDLLPFKNYTFKDNERLVIVADSALSKTFDDLPVNILTNFQSCLRDYNIAHFFIVILSNIPSIRTDLDLVHKKYYYQESNSITNIFLYKDN